MTSLTGLADVPLVGRERELAAVLRQLENAGNGSARLVLLDGEAGIGKTRLAREVIEKAVAQGWRALMGKCLHESLAAYTPIIEALRSGKMEYLMEFTSPPRIDHVLLISRDGRVCATAHRTGSNLDSEIFAGMLTAVNAFVKESLNGMTCGEAGEMASSGMDYGNYHILVESREFGILVVVLIGQTTELLKDEMVGVMSRIGRLHGKLFREWTGDVNAMAPLRPEVEQFLNCGKYDGEDTVTEPENRHWRLLMNVTRGLARACRENPMLMFLDDMQWADPSSLGMVRHLMTRLKGERFLILGTCRPVESGESNPLSSVRKELSAENLVEELTLERLDKESVNKIVEQEIGDAGHGPLGDAIGGASGGVPFLVRETIALLRDEGAVVKTGGNWTLARPVVKIGIPKRVREAVVARLRVLTKEEGEVIETAAVLGELFRPAHVSCVLGMNSLQIHRTLHGIEKWYGLVRSVESGEWYKFDHPMLREVVYNEIPAAMRVECHNTAVDCIIRNGGAGLAHLARVAYHARAGKHPDAMKHLKSAGDAARKEYQTDETVRFYRAALEIADVGEQASLLKTIGETLYDGGRFEEAVDWLEKAGKASGEKSEKVMLAARRSRAFDRLGRPQEGMDALDNEEPDRETAAPAKARWLSARAWLRYVIMDYDGAESDASEALQVIETTSPLWADDMADCWNTLGASSHLTGMLTKAIEQFRRGLIVAEEGNAPFQAVRIMGNLCAVEMDVGHYGEALALSDRALYKAEKMGNRLFIAICLVRKGQAQFVLGHTSESYESWSAAMEMYKEIGLSAYVPSMLVLRAACALELGLPEEAEQDARKALALTEEGSRMFHLDAMTNLAEVVALRCRASPVEYGSMSPEERCSIDDAEALARLAVDGYRASGSQRGLSWALRNLALVLAVQNRREEAKEAFRDALDEHGIFMGAWNNAQGLRWWGEALDEWGEKEHAKEKYEEARKLFAAMGAAKELVKVEGALARLKK
jgi:tetratricopeptide (TPR) repeat protein/predicted regulator of Ras-like GTPase activity (Roadblock/LC7/MglB family)